MIFKLLRNARLEDCLAWYEGAPDDHIRDILRPLLFNTQAGPTGAIQEAAPQQKLVDLAHKDDAFRRFIEAWFCKSLDRVTAAYLKEMMES